MSRFKIGDRVLIASNYHYQKPRRIVEITTLLLYPNTIAYHLYGVRYPWNNSYIAFTEEDLIHEDVYNSPLWKALNES